MNCLNNENVCSVKKEDNIGYYRLHTIWKNDGFFINIASKNGAWRGEMTPSDVAKLSSQLELEPKAYLEQCKTALTSHGGQSGMVYAVENGYFAWKKVEDEDSGIKVVMGSVMLEPASFVDTIQNVVTAALNCNKNLEDKLKKIKEEKEGVLENRNNLISKLNELIKTKETMENDLYTRFIVLINEKKKKIQELENLLEEGYKNRGSSKTKNQNNPYEVDTENDSEEEKVKSQRKRKIVKVRKKASSSPEEKKIKIDKNLLGESVRCLSPKPSTSTADEDNKEEKESQPISLTEATTKDELYDFFYGEL